MIAHNKTVHLNQEFLNFEHDFFQLTPILQMDLAKFTDGQGIMGQTNGIDV